MLIIFSGCLGRLLNVCPCILKWPSLSFTLSRLLGVRVGTLHVVTPHFTPSKAGLRRSDVPLSLCPPAGVHVCMMSTSRFVCPSLLLCLCVWLRLRVSVCLCASESSVRCLIVTSALPLRGGSGRSGGAQWRAGALHWPAAHPDLVTGECCARGRKGGILAFLHNSSV